MDDRIDRYLDRHGVIARRDHPGLARRLAHLVENGRLAPVLPGVYARPEDAARLDVRARAACRYDRRAVIVGEAAAALTFWPELDVDAVAVAGTRSTLRRPGFTFTRGQVPTVLVRRRAGLNVTEPALTALDLVAGHGGAGIDRVLRSRRTTLARMRVALRLTPGRPGNIDRRAMLLDSRDRPWSELERRMHRLLRQAGIRGWSSNVGIEIANTLYYVDILFHKLPLVIEMDGRAFHGPDRFDSDRERGNLLALAGKMVLRFTWRQVTQRPEWVVRQVRAALARCGAA